MYKATHEELLRSAASAKPQASVTVLEKAMLLYPHQDLLSSAARIPRVHVRAACAVRVHDAGDATHPAGGHVVVIGVHRDPEGELVWGVWCHDHYLEPRPFTTPEDSEAYATMLISHALAALDLPATDPRHDQLARQLRSAHERFPASQRCDFWNSYRRTRTPCRHVEHVLATLHQEGLAQLTGQLQDLLTRELPAVPDQ